MKHIETLNYKVFSDDLSKIPILNGTCQIINTISPNSYGVAKKDYEFEQALKESDYLVLDGVYFALGSILIKGKNIKKNQGPEVFDHFMKRLKKTDGKVFFLGSSQNTLDKIESRIHLELPDVKVASFSPPFKAKFSIQDNKEMIEKINEFKPDILFIGMTCPKQEKWAIKNKDELDAGLAICIGNVFDWYARTQKSIHPIWFKLRMAWFIRILIRPEVFKRNIGNQMTFFIDILLIKLKIKTI